MAKRPDDFLDTHVVMSVAAAVAYGQLVPREARKPYDAEHLGEILNLVAAALARLADGSTFTGLTLRRRDVREAICILRRIGFEAILAEKTTARSGQECANDSARLY